MPIRVTLKSCEIQIVQNVQVVDEKFQIMAVFSE